MSWFDRIPSLARSRRSVIGSGLSVAGGAILGLRFVQAEDDGSEHWSYEGDTGPDNWGDLSEEFESCAIGEHQSPINLTSEQAVDADLPNVAINYAAMSAFEIEDNGHTVRVPIANNSFAELNGEQYQLIEFHFHAPSEHAIEGEQDAMELHLVHAHQDDPARKLVLGVLIAVGAENAALAPVFANLPDAVDGLRLIDQALDPAACLPGNRQSFRYAGSLTTPPCSEGVSWVVFSERVEASSEQIDRFLELHAGNARPFRDPEDREIHEDTTP